MNRRGLMKMMGMGAVAAPIAVPHIGAMPALGTELAGLATSTGGAYYGSVGEAIRPSGSASRTISRAALQLTGIPSWLTAQWDEASREVHAFDPDIASYRFMSLPAKLALQRKRNRQRIEASWWKPSAWREQQKWQETHGYINDD